jgi:hypothetical protein
VAQGGEECEDHSLKNYATHIESQSVFRGLNCSGATLASFAETLASQAMLAGFEDTVGLSILRPSLSYGLGTADCSLGELLGDNLRIFVVQGTLNWLS